MTIQSAAGRRMEGAYEEALEAYSKLLNHPQRGVAAACGLARCYLETGRYEEAIEALRAVEESGGEAAEWGRTLAEVLTTVGRYDDALELLRRVVKLHPEDHQARNLLGGVYEAVGRRAEAIETYRRFNELLTRSGPRGMNPAARGGGAALTALGAGVLRYSVLTRHPQLAERTRHVLQDVYQRAYERIDRGYWPARLAAADLLRAKWRRDQAREDYLAALRINAHLAAAHVGLGWIAQSRWDFEEVERRIGLARDCNPRSIGACRLEAALRLTERRFADALAAAERGLGINPNDVEGLGYAAAASYALNDGVSLNRFRERAERVTRLPGGFHRVMGDTLGALRQYAESESAYLAAIAADPTDPRPRTELGLMYMQWGEEEKAHTVLTAAWELDDFDARTLNTLSLLETLESFARHETEHFVIKYDASKDAVLGPYMAEYLEGIHQELCDDFDWTGSSKTIIEVFPTHRMFGVRITGKPWIHTVGACTGRVIAMESPRRHPQLQGPYNYARVLRHEYTHTVTLGATGNRIPHWFTEGLAVMQEDSPRPFVWCRILADAVRMGELFTLESIDWAFVRPRRPNDRQTAYAQSEWMCEFIVARHGYGALNEMIRGYRGRKRQPDVLRSVLGLSPEEFDRAFAGWAGVQAGYWGLNLTPPEDVAALRAQATMQPEDAGVLARLARAELDTGNPTAAIAAAAAAMDIDEDNVVAVQVLAEALWLAWEHAGRGARPPDLEDAMVTLMERLLDLDESGWLAPKALGTVAVERGRDQEAVEHFRRLKRVLPLDPTSDRVLAGIFLGRGESDQALPHLLGLARAQVDDADIPLTIGSIHVEAGRLEEARYWLTQSLYVDAYAVEAHETLAAVCEKLGDTQTALREYRALCVLEPDTVKHFERAAGAFEKLGDRASAMQFARRAVAIDPATSVGYLADEGEREGTQVIYRAAKRPPSTRRLTPVM